MKKIVLVGSSIFERWKDVTKMLSGYRVINRAVGGTETSDWVKSLESVLITEKPDVILYYAGSNDLTSAIPPENILSNVLKCRAIILEKSLLIKFVFFGIIKAPEKKGKWDIIDRLNKNILTELQARDLFIDPNTLLFHGDAGIPVEGFYLEDGLHLTEKAYANLADFTGPIIKRWLIQYP